MGCQHILSLPSTDFSLSLLATKTFCLLTCMLVCQGCCRPDTLINNPNSPWKLSTTIVLSSELPNESPIIALPPAVTAIQGRALSFTLAAFQAEGHVLSYRVGSAEEHNPVDIVGKAQGFTSIQRAIMNKSAALSLSGSHILTV